MNDGVFPPFHLSRFLVIDRSICRSIDHSLVRYNTHMLKYVRLNEFFKQVCTHVITNQDTDCNIPECPLTPPPIRPLSEPNTHPKGYDYSDFLHHWLIFFCPFLNFFNVKVHDTYSFIFDASCTIYHLWESHASLCVSVFLVATAE